MQRKDIHAAILRVFNQHRETPDAPFEYEKFLDFLMTDNRPLDKLRRSFRGLWRLNRFYDALQLECAVCFEHGVSEKNWSVADLAAHIADKKENTGAQKSMVTKRIKKAERNLYFEPAKIGLFIVAPLFLYPASIAFKLGAHVITVALLMLAVGAVGFCYSITRREVVLYRKLRQRLEEDC